MKLCPRCGTNCPDEAFYCTLCGTQLPAEQQPPYGNQQPPSYNPNGQYYGNQPNQFQGNPPYGNQQYQPYPIPGQYPYSMPRKSCTMVLAIIGLIFSLLIPGVTYCCSIPGIVLANRDLRNGYDSRRARILNIIALCVAGVNSLLGVILFLSNSAYLF